MLPRQHSSSTSNNFSVLLSLRSAQQYMEVRCGQPAPSTQFFEWSVILVSATFTSTAHWPLKTWLSSFVSWMAKQLLQSYNHSAKSILIPASPCWNWSRALLWANAGTHSTPGALLPWTQGKTTHVTLWTIQEQLRIRECSGWCSSPVCHPIARTTTAWWTRWRTRLMTSTADMWLATNDGSIMQSAKWRYSYSNNVYKWNVLESVSVVYALCT
jgi:hypothetical protein